MLFELRFKALKPAQSILLSLGLTQVCKCRSNLTPNRYMDAIIQLGEIRFSRIQSDGHIYIHFKSPVSKD